MIIDIEQVTCQYLRSIALSSCARLCISMAVANFDAANIDFSNHTNINISGPLKCIHSFPLVVLWRKVTYLNMNFFKRVLDTFCIKLPLLPYLVLRVSQVFAETQGILSKYLKGHSVPRVSDVFFCYSKNFVVFLFLDTFHIQSKHLKGR